MLRSMTDNIATHDEQDLAAFGYAQQLRRRLGPYASFAAGFSFVSIMTTVFQLFALGYSFGGAAEITAHGGWLAYLRSTPLLFSGPPMRGARPPR